MRKLLFSLFVLIFFFSLVGSVSATTYFVRTDGNDANDGLTNSSGGAWLTIQNSVGTVSAGDTVRVQSGTYEGSLRIINVDGNATHRISFIGDGLPVITWSNESDTDVVQIASNYINFTGFNITTNETLNGLTLGKGGSGARAATHLNISNNYIDVVDNLASHATTGRGIQLVIAGTGNYSIIDNNTIVADKAGIYIGSGPVYNLTIIYNNVTAAAGTEDGGGGGDYGIGTYGSGGYYLNVSYNTIYRSGWTAMKMENENSVFIGNEITDKPCHNSIDTIGSYSRWIDTYIHDINSTYAQRADSDFYCTNNQFYKAGADYITNIYIENLTIKNPGGGRGISVGGMMSDFLINKSTITNHSGLPLQLGATEDSGYLWEGRSTNNATFIDVDIEGTGTEVVSIISLGTNTSNNHSDWTAYEEDKVTFINFNATGTYTGATWKITNDVAYSPNWHFNATIRVINTNKDDTSFVPQQPVAGYGLWLNGSMIFYQYVDVQVQDSGGTNLSGVNVSFTSNVSASDLPAWLSTPQCKNVDYRASGYEGETADRTWTTTGADGHTPLPSNKTWTVACPYKFQNLTNTITFNWTINASKTSYNSSTANIIPNLSWYRTNSNTVQNTTLITLGGGGSGGVLWQLSVNSSTSNGTFLDITNVQATGNLELGKLVDNYWSYWRGDEGSGTTLNDENTTTGNDGNMNTLNYTTIVKYGGSAINCSGSDEVSLGTKFIFGDTGTYGLSFWYNNSGLAFIQYQMILGDTASGDYIDLDASSMFMQQSSGVDARKWTGLTNSNNSFDHWFFSWNGTDILLYKNGNNLGVADVTPESNRFFEINTLCDGWNNFNYDSEGIIDDIRIFNFTLSDVQVNQTRDNEHKSSGTYTTEYINLLGTNAGTVEFWFSDLDISKGNYSAWVNGTSIVTNGSNATQYNVPAGFSALNITTLYQTSVANYTPIGYDIIIRAAGDSTAPVVTPNNMNGTTTNDNTPDFNVTATDNTDLNGGGCLFINETGYGCNSSAISNNTAFTLTANASLADGYREWYVNVTDAAGNVGKSATRNFTVDTTGPTVTIDNPLNDTYGNVTMVANGGMYYNATLNEAGSWCGYSLNGAANVTMSNDSSTHWYSFNNTYNDFVNIPIVISCNDTLGNMGSSTVYFSIDTVFGTIDWGSLVNNSWTNITSFTQNLKCSDTNLLKCNRTFSYQNGTVFNNTYVTDLAVTTYNFTSDVDISSVPSGQNLTIEMCVADDDGDANFKRQKKSETSLVFGKKSYDFKFKGQGKLKTENVDSIIAAGDEILSVDISFWNNGKPIKKSPSTLTSILDYNYRQGIYDNREYKIYTNLTADKPIDEIRYKFTSDSFVWREPVSGRVGHALYADGDMYSTCDDLDTIQINGINVSTKVTSELIDSNSFYCIIKPDTTIKNKDFVEIDPIVGGTNSLCETFTYQIDRATPTITVNSEQNQSLNGTSYFGNVTGSETIDTLKYNLNGTIYTNGSCTTECTINMTGLASGNYTTVNATINDSAGNSVTSSNFWIYIVGDTIVPVVTIASPSNNSNFTFYTGSVPADRNVSIVFSASDANLDSTWYSIDGGVNTTVSDNFTLSNHFFRSYTVTVYANDSAGNVGSASVSYNILFKPSSGLGGIGGGGGGGGYIPPPVEVVVGVVEEVAEVVVEMVEAPPFMAFSVIMIVIGFLYLRKEKGGGSSSKTGSTGFSKSLKKAFSKKKKKGFDDKPEDKKVLSEKALKKLRDFKG